MARIFALVATLFLVGCQSQIGGDFKLQQNANQNAEESAQELPSDEGSLNKECAIPENMPVALFGDTNRQDSGLGKVLRLSELEETQLYILLGDYAYTSQESGIVEFMDLVDYHVPSDKPMVAVLGNHDSEPWQPYANYFQERTFAASATNPNFSCHNQDNLVENLGRNSFCTFYDMLVVSSGILLSVNFDGSSYQSAKFDPHMDYMHEIYGQLGNRYLWRITALHQPTTSWNVEGKHTNGLEPMYSELLPYGSWIVAGHAHHYARGKGFTSMEGDEFVDGKGNTGINLDLQSLDPISTTSATYLRSGVSSTLVNGFGGQAPRERLRCFDDSEPGCSQIAASFTKTEGVKNAPVICKFNYEGDCSRAHCYLKSAENCATGVNTDNECLAGEIFDEFDLYSTDLNQ